MRAHDPAHNQFLLPSRTQLNLSSSHGGVSEFFYLRLIKTEEQSFAKTEICLSFNKLRRIHSQLVW
ncbi:hypothetical protein CUMW_140750 [Citrus unshiu]|uniref:Uncharacterized protein n=1 Tax=Citrus unshiu TaxID=55188 RepID=A0A2H5PIY5_CITUN|nr:hypothetical protein CUMW_140750 [Citrus unshiu]